jgi:uncharacterized membrane protein YhaH (DUF805 family)
MGQLLFSFQGRLNRQPWWIVTIILVVILIVLVGALIAVAGLAVVSGDLAALGLTGIILIILYIPVIWIGLALGAKRLHDRNKSAWWLLLFYALPMVLNAIPAGEGGKMILSLAGLAISIWALVELGFLRGTTGPNNYGPDPLATA